MTVAGNTVEWQIRPPAHVCARCARSFGDGEAIRSRLLFVEGEGYRREDVCQACGGGANETSVFSWWKGTFHVPPPPPAEPLKRETAESLLRRLIEEGGGAHAGAIFVLSVMLERRRVLVEREVRFHEDGRRTRIYEHRVTGESFIILDPGLRLDDLEKVQAEVLELLGEKQDKGATAPAAVPPTDQGASSCLT